MIIQDYAFGSMTIDGIRYDSDLKTFPDHIASHWWRKEGHSLELEDITDLLESAPRILIIGTGYSGFMKVPDDLRKYIADQGVTLIIERTVDAWKTYNNLSASRKVVAAFHLTC